MRSIWLRDTHCLVEALCRTSSSLFRISYYSYGLRSWMVGCICVSTNAMHHSDRSHSTIKYIFFPLSITFALCLLSDHWLIFIYSFDEPELSAGFISSCASMSSAYVRRGYNLFQLAFKPDSLFACNLSLDFK